MAGLGEQGERKERARHEGPAKAKGSGNSSLLTTARRPWVPRGP